MQFFENNCIMIRWVDTITKKVALNESFDISKMKTDYFF